MEEQNGHVEYRWAPDLGIQRDNAESAIGVVSVATHKDGWFRVDWMSMADVYRIRDRSPSYKAKREASPWTTDAGEMAKKTGIRRLLKTFDDDPGLLKALEFSREDDPTEEQAVAAIEARQTSSPAPQVVAELAPYEEQDSPAEQTEPNLPLDEQIDPVAWADAWIEQIPNTVRAKARREATDVLAANCERLSQEQYERCAKAAMAAGWIL